MPPEIEFDWVLSELKTERLAELALMDFNWSAQVAAKAGAFIFKSVSQTGLIRLNVSQPNLFQRAPAKLYIHFSPLP